MLEEKIDELTKAVVALRASIEGQGGAAAAKKPAAKKPAADDDDDDDAPKAKPAAKAKAKPKAEEPEHDEDEVGAKFRAAAKLDKPRCKKYLGKVECEDLAELLTKPELFDAAYAFAEKVIAENSGDDDDDD